MRALLFKWISLIGLFTPGVLTAATVTFLSGSISIQENGKSRLAKVGEKVSSPQLLISKKKGVLRLTLQNQQFTVRFPGEYEVGNLLSAAQSSSRGRSFLANALKNNAGQPVPSVGAGTRASDPNEMMGVFSMSSSGTSVPVQQLQTWLKNGDYGKVEKTVLEPVSGYESYALGFSLYMLNKPAAAKSHLKQAMREAETAQVRGQSASALATIYFTEGDYLMAFNTGERFQKTHSNKEVPAEIFYIHALAAETLGKSVAFKKSMENLKRFHPRSKLSTILGK